MSEDRHSEAEGVELIQDPIERAEREAENGIRQTNAALSVVAGAITATKPFRLTQKVILDLHREALDGIHLLAGTYRNSLVKIGKSHHMPPHYSEVADLVAEMCQYVNDHWGDRSACHLAAYVLWRICWIHPFADGNGRTARAISYLVLSIAMESVLPGSPTIPELIAKDKRPYYAELEKADESWKNGSLALASLETMIEGLLAEQLLSAVQKAGL
ncbi:MAG: Fic family protein [Pseudomonadota bacterium]